MLWPIRRMFLLFFLTLFSIKSVTAHNTIIPDTKESFDNQYFVDLCGGIAYNNCDIYSEVSQEDIFLKAFSKAEKSKRNLVVIFGADWCPACLSFDAMMNAGDKKWYDDFNSEFVLVKITSDIASTNKIKKNYNMPVTGVPTTYLYSIEKKRPTFNFVGVPDDLSSYLNNLKKANGPSSGKGKEEYDYENASYIANIPQDLLRRSIEMEDGFGKTTPLITIFSSDNNNKEKAQKYFNQGMARLHSFHWIDAFRFFYQSQNTVPSGSSKLGMSYALLKMMEGSRSDFYASQWAYDLNNEAVELLKETGFYIHEIQWAKALTFKLCKANVAFCDDEHFLNKSPNFQISEDRAWKKISDFSLIGSDFLSLAGWNLKDRSKVIRSLEMSPIHPGGNHYLGHLYEGQDNHVKAKQFLRIFSLRAPKSPHAQHMYGHVLPQHGMWKEAAHQFAITHDLHLDWGIKNSTNPLNDWHFSHNLDLYLPTLMVLEDKKTLEDIIELSCGVSNGSRMACFKSTQILLVNGNYDKALSLFESQFNFSNKLDSFKNIVAFYREFNEGKIKIAHDLYKDSNFGRLKRSYFSSLIESVLLKTGDNQLLEEVKVQLPQIMNMGGFEGWSHYLMTYYLALKGLEKHGYKKTAAYIRKSVKNPPYPVESNLKSFLQNKLESILRSIEDVINK